MTFIAAKKKGEINATRAKGGESRRARNYYCFFEGERVEKLEWRLDEIEAAAPFSCTQFDNNSHHFSLKNVIYKQLCC